MNTQWEFKSDGQGWFWVCCDGGPLMESQRFASPEACIADAELHGYTDGIPVPAED
jgi:hypothetical protein